MRMRKSRQIGDLIPPHTVRVGKPNEDRVEKVLERLKAEGEIHHHYRQDPGGELDRQGIDFLVYPEADWIIPLQVKSSFAGMDDHFIKHGHRIPCIIVVDDYDDDTLREKVLNGTGSGWNLIISSRMILN